MLRLAPEYGCWPIWNPEPNDTHDYNVDPRTLPISAALCEALEAWADEHYATLNQDYPPDSKFPSLEAEQAWRARGGQLLAQLKSELPGVAWTSRF
ncbi:hypothetical protein U91I_04154 [alpha proteobacterium U9-1i]|nr:hypothetical protein U91I_04154 [alpha proteobacterium U9-1i]